MKIRKSVKEDIPRVLEIYADARRRMRESGNPTQWGDVWPPDDMIREDCSPEGHGYVIADGERICGVFAFYLGEDELLWLLLCRWIFTTEPLGAPLLSG